MTLDQLENFLRNALLLHSFWVLLLSFVAGVASSLLPCSVTMLPVLIGYIGGYASASKMGVAVQAALFTLGIALVMTAMGLVASLLGLTFGGLLGNAWYAIIGLLALGMGLQLLDVLHVPMPSLVRRLPESAPGRTLAPLLLGMAFGLAASPCGTPFLAVILGFISREHQVALGGGALFCYALGQGMLLLTVGIFTGLLKRLAVFRRVGVVVNRLSGAAFIVAGLLMLAEAAGVLAPVLTFLRLI